LSVSHEKEPLLKKTPEKENPPGRWRAADEKLSRLLKGEGRGTEGLTEEELATVCARRFEKAGAETRVGLIRLALKLRSPLTAKALVAKTTGRLGLDMLASLAELVPLAGEAPAWLVEAPALRSAMQEVAAALREGRPVALETEAVSLSGIAEPLQFAALRSLVEGAGEAVVPLARALTERAPDRTPEIAETLSGVASLEVGKFLLELLSEAQDKGVAKAVRRSLARLRQAGVKIEVPSEGAPVFRPPERARPQAYVTGIDGEGARLVFLVQPRVPHGVQFFEALISDGRGLIEFKGYETHQRGVEKYLASLREQPRLLFTATTPSYARLLLHEALECNVRSGTRVPPGASELRPSWDVGDEPPGPPPEIPTGEETEDLKSALTSSARLLDHEGLRGWYINPDLVRPTMERVREATASKILLTPLQKQERLASLVREATDEIFGESLAGSARARYVRRLSETAYLLAAHGELGAAAQARAAAAHLGDAGSRASLNPFAYALVEKTVSILLRAQEEREQEARKADESSLLVKP
jgi:hypothetical protein